MEASRAWCESRRFRAEVQVRYDSGMEWCLAPGVAAQLIVAGALLVVSATGLVVASFLKKSDRLTLPFAFATILLAGALVGAATAALDPTTSVAASVLTRC